MIFIISLLRVGCPLKQKDHLIILWLGRFVSGDVEMTDQANQHPEDSGALWTGNGGCCWRLEALLFLSCLCCSAASIQLDSWDFALLRTAAHHLSLSIAVCSHRLWQMLKAISESLRVSSDL